MSTLHIAPGVDLPLSVITSKQAILAMTGQGKTYLAKVIAEEMMKAGAQICAVDYTGVWYGLQSSASGKRAGLNVVIFGGDHANVPINEQSGSLIADVIVNERISAVLDVSGFEHDAEKIRFLNAFARRLYFINKRPIHLFIDEADEFVPQNPQRYADKRLGEVPQVALLSAIKRIWQRGRIKGIGGSLISQRSALVNKSLLSQSEILIALRTVSPQDRAALKAWFDSWGTEDQIAKFESTISNLDDFHAWFWSPRHKLFKVAKARTLETFDSSATPDTIDMIAEPERRTEIDVAKLGKQIEKLAAETKSNDPAVLAKQLAHYKEQFETSRKRYVVLEERLRKRDKPAAAPKPIKVPTLSAQTRKQLEKVLRNIASERRAVSSTLGELSQRIATDADQMLVKLHKEVERTLQAAMTTVPATVERMAPGVQFKPLPPFDGTQERVSTPIKSGGGGMRNILIALAQHGALTETKAKALSGIAKRPTFVEYVRRLKRSGDVQTNGHGTIELTPDGRARLGTYEPLPTGAALLQYWSNELGSGGMGDIFQIVAATPNQLAFDNVQKAAGIENRATFVEYVRRLRRLELVEVGKLGGKEWVRLAEGLRE